MIYKKIKAVFFIIVLKFETIFNINISVNIDTQEQTHIHTYEHKNT